MRRSLGGLLAIAAVAVALVHAQAPGLLWLGVGKDDNLVGSQAKTLEATLVAKGIKHVY